MLKRLGFLILWIGLSLPQQGFCVFGESDKESTVIPRRTATPISSFSMTQGQRDQECYLPRRTQEPSAKDSEPQHTTFRFPRKVIYIGLPILCCTTLAAGVGVGILYALYFHPFLCQPCQIDYNNYEDS